jgi:2Fe-2S ferredoxin
MPKIIATNRVGRTHVIEAVAGSNAMRAMREAGIEDILALCGGFCSCATCHVHVAPDWAGRVGGAGPDEAGLLESSDHATPNSRLACQIIMTAALDGLELRVAPED